MKPHYNLRKVACSKIAVATAAGAFVLTIVLLCPWGNSRQETVFVSRLLSQSPRVVVHSSTPLADPRDETCTHFTCFDVYKCGHTSSRITVYIYPIARYVDEYGNALVQQPSREFMELIDEIQQSEFYTSDPTKACLFVPPLDLLNESNIKPKAISQILNSLPHWNNGTNHVLFNMLPGTAPDYAEIIGVNTGRALIMGGGFSTWTYRRGYDISIPVFNPARCSVKSSLSERNRPWLVVASQPHIHFEFRSEIASLASENAGVIQLGLCSHAWDPKNATIRCLGEKVFKYPNLLKEANFCFVIRAARLGQSGLSDALMASCVPIVVADSYVLPFSEVLDWKRAAFQIREDELHNTVKILHGVSELRIAEMRDQCRLLWERYFSSMARIGRTVLLILNDRIFPHVSVWLALEEQYYSS
uniref:Exostosin GT47 domain-containing protein n=1 Tax=Ornithodoros moubata TaxID=6938 RepID=A0A1Z5L165_ORNMO